MQNTTSMQTRSGLSDASDPILNTGYHAASVLAEPYDAERHDNRIVALYETPAKARAARDDLRAEGVPEQAILLSDAATDTLAGAVPQNRLEGGYPTSQAAPGLWDSIRDIFMPDEDAHGFHEGMRRGHAMLAVIVQPGMDRARIVDLLERSDPIDLDAKMAEWGQSGWQRPDLDLSGMTGAGTPPATAVHLPDELPSAPGTSRPVIADRADATLDAGDAMTEVIPVVEERLRIGKREVAHGAVRVRSYVVERPVEAQVRLRQERVSVDRHPVDRLLDPGEDPAFQERVIEAHSVSEEPVVTKEARVTEEVTLRKEAVDREEIIRDTVRRTEVSVEGGRDRESLNEEKTGIGRRTSQSSPSSNPHPT